MGFKKTKQKNINQKYISRLAVITATMVVSLVIPNLVFSQEQSIANSPIIKIESLGGNISVLGDFVVGPGKFDAMLNPGQARSFNLNVTNRMGEERVFKIEIEDFTGSRNLDQTVVLLGDERGPYSLRDYINVPAREFTLGHGEKATIPITVSIPYDEEPGGRYGSVIISTVSKPADPGDGEIRGGAAIISRIGTLFFVRVPGVAEESGSVQKFQTKANKKFFTSLPVFFEILFENSGSVHLAPYGEIRINNILGKEVDVIEIDPWFVLPESLRLREVAWERNWVIGLYNAHVLVNRSYGDIIDENSFMFFVLPWKPLVILLVVIFVLFLFIRFISGRFEFRRKIKENN